MKLTENIDSMMRDFVPGSVGSGFCGFTASTQHNDAADLWRMTTNE